VEAITFMTFTPLLTILVPALGGVLAVAFGRFGAGGRVFALGIFSAITVALALAAIPGALAGTAQELLLLHLTPQIWLRLRVDAAGALFAATVSMLFLLALVYSAGYLRSHGRHGRYYSFFMLCQACMIGVAYSGNLLTLLVFYELFSLLTYPLVIHEETPEAMRAGLKYIVYILVGGSLVLLGVIFAFHLAGDRPFAPGGILGGRTDPPLVAAMFWCFLAGFGVKAALMPLHGWVPDVHPAAPASFSAVLSGVMVAAGCFGMTRVIFEVFGVELARALGLMPWVAAAASISVLLAALLAISEDDLKRRLAWSTISQMAYVVLAFSLLSPAVTAAALVHISHHAFLKGALFFCAGAFASQAGIRRVSELRGVGARMPVTTAVFAIAALGLVGIPPLSGFVSKWLLGTGMLEAGSAPALLVLLGGALLAAFYLLPPVWLAYFATAREPQQGAAIREAPGTMVFAMAATAVISLLFGLAATLPGLPLSLAHCAVAAFFGGG
jgi:multicomponent Na+:H+ antiporter subunit D